MLSGVEFLRGSYWKLKSSDIVMMKLPTLKYTSDHILLKSVELPVTKILKQSFSFGTKIKLNI